MRVAKEKLRRRNALVGRVLTQCDDISRSAIAQVRMEQRAVAGPCPAYRDRYQIIDDLLGGASPVTMTQQVEAARAGPRLTRSISWQRSQVAVKL